jgi:zinc and cadmium transporter
MSRCNQRRRCCVPQLQHNNNNNTSLLFMQTLIYILLATTLAGVVSALAAATLSLTVLERYSKHLVSFSVGAMLAAAFLNLIPEAAESGLSMHSIGITVLAGLVTFFILEKYALWRHAHAEGDGHANHSHHAHGHSHTHHSHSHGHEQPQAFLIVLGDSVHNFADGVLIAAAFLQDTTLGIATTAAIAAHEVPQEVGDYMVMLAGGMARKKALLLNLMAGFAAVAGGVLGYFVLASLKPWVPYVLVFSAASFIYIAVADLVPQLHRNHRVQLAPLQLALIALGIATVEVLSHTLKHAH